jgi:hypothetical protein
MIFVNCRWIFMFMFGDCGDFKVCFFWEWICFESWLLVVVTMNGFLCLGYWILLIGHSIMFRTYIFISYVHLDINNLLLWGYRLAIYFHILLGIYVGVIVYNFLFIVYLNSYGLFLYLWGKTVFKVSGYIF